MLRRGERLLGALLGVAAFACIGATPQPEGRATSPVPYELTYEGARGCPSVAAFRNDALAHVHDLSGAAGARVTVHIMALDAGFRGELVATDEEGHEGRRSIDGPKCSNVAHALAFLAGLAIELGGHLERDEEPAPAPLPSPPPPRPPAAERPAPRRSAPPRSSGGVAIASTLLGEVRSGLAPVWRPALSLAFDLEDRRVKAVAPSLRVAVTGARSELDTANGRASLSFLAGRLEGCPLRFGDRSVAVRPCLALEVGHVWAQSHASENPRDATQLFPSAEALLRLKWRIFGGLFLESDVAAGVPILRPKYFFEPDRVLYQVPRLTARAALGLGWRF